MQSVIGKVVFKDGTFVIQSLVMVDMGDGEGNVPEIEMAIADFDAGIHVLGTEVESPELINQYSFQQGVYERISDGNMYRFLNMTMEGKVRLCSLEDPEGIITVNKGEVTRKSREG
jgi:hypothetical protein